MSRRRRQRVLPSELLQEPELLRVQVLLREPVLPPVQEPLRELQKELRLLLRLQLRKLFHSR